MTLCGIAHLYPPIWHADYLAASRLVIFSLKINACLLFASQLPSPNNSQEPRRYRFHHLLPLLLLLEGDK